MKLFKEKQLWKMQLEAPQSQKMLWVIVCIGVLFAILPIVNAFSWVNSSGANQNKDYLNNSLISYYNFDEFGGNLTDIFSGTKNMTVNGTPTRRVAGIIGKAYKHNSITDDKEYILDYDTSLGGEKSYSVSMWIYFNSFKTEDYIFQLGDTITTSRGLEQYLGNLTYQTIGGGQIQGAPIGLGRWIHVVHTFNSISKDNLVYVNNTLYINQSDTGSIDANPDLYFGHYRSGVRSLNGSIDEVGIWNKTLNTTEISALWNNGYGLTRSFNILSWLENSQTYNAATTSGNSETFILNLTYDTSDYTNILPIFVYNNTNYTGVTKTGTGNNILLTKVLAVPSVTSQQNFTFYWIIGLINSSGTTYYNSNSHNQTINPVLIDDCSSYTNLVLNYTMKDEITQLDINSSYYNSSIQLNLQFYSYSESTLINNLSKLYNKTNNAKICLQNQLTNNSQYRLYSQVRYYADGYSTKHNYIQNFTLTNLTVPQHINLFALESSKSIPFQILYKDESFIPVKGALISINKEYLSENTYKAVEIEKTDDYGRANAVFDLTSGRKYQIIVSKEGQILSTFSNVNVYCTDTINYNCPLNLNAASSTGTYIDFWTYHGISLLPSFDQSTRTYSLTFSTLDNSVSTVGIELVKLDNYGNLTLYSGNVTTSSGSLSYAIPSSYGNISFQAKIIKDGEYIAYNVYKIVSYTAGTNPFAGNLVVFGIGIVLVTATLFIPSAIGVIIGGIIGVGLLIYFFFIGEGLLASGFFIALLIAGGILIWRLRHGGND